jgi:hypothetical protein
MAILATETVTRRCGARCFRLSRSERRLIKGEERVAIYLAG